jgi:hypothetical protein
VITSYFVCGKYLSGGFFLHQYSSGTGAFIPLGTDLLTLDEENAQKITFNATGSHPHQVVEVGDEVLIPDLVSRLKCHYIHETDSRWVLSWLVGIGCRQGMAAYAVDFDPGYCA